MIFIIPVRVDGARLEFSGDRRRNIVEWSRFGADQAGLMNYPAASNGVSSKALNAPKDGGYNSCPPPAVCLDNFVKAEKK